MAVNVSLALNKVGEPSFKITKSLSLAKSYITFPFDEFVEEPHNMFWALKSPNTILCTFCFREILETIDEDKLMSNSL